MIGRKRSRRASEEGWLPSSKANAANQRRHSQDEPKRKNAASNANARAIVLPIVVKDRPRGDAKLTARVASKGEDPAKSSAREENVADQSQARRAKSNSSKHSDNAEDLQLVKEQPHPDPKEASPPKRKLLLGEFQCPYMHKCPFDANVGGGQCPFAHGDVSEEVMPLPNHVCVPYLLKMIGFEAGAFRHPIVECMDENDGQCRFGVHLTVQELRFDFSTNRHMQSKIESFLALYPDEKFMCNVCRKNIALKQRAPELQEYAVLAGCDHVHCASCIRWERVRSAPACYKRCQDPTHHRCRIYCTGTELVHYQRYDPTIEDKVAKAALFADAVPELQPDWKAVEDVDKVLCDNHQKFEALAKAENLCEVPRTEKHFNEWLHVNLDNAAVYELVRQIANDFDRVATKKTLKLWAPPTNEFVVPAWMERDHREYVEYLLSKMTLEQKRRSTNVKFAQKQQHCTLTYKWKRGHKFVLCWRTLNSDQNVATSVRVIPLNGPQGREVRLKRKDFRLQLQDGKIIGPANRDHSPSVSYFRYHFAH